MNYINKLQNNLMKEKEHSAFLEKLLKTLFGDGWGRLTLYEAEQWHRRHLTRHSSERAGPCGDGEHGEGYYRDEDGSVSFR